jgi:O-antigen/teichoic acid export membrane protein
MTRVSGTAAGASTRSEADDATRGSAVRLAAEVASRLVLFATTLLLSRWLGPTLYGLFAKLSAFALLLAEVGELGLSVLASRALVAGTISLRSFVRARLVLLGLVAGVAAAAVRLAPDAWPLLGGSPSGPEEAAAGVGVLLALFVGWFALSGWAEFLGVALRCRRARRLEAVLLLFLRASALALTVVALVGGTGLAGVAVALAVSPLPAIALGASFLRRTPASPAPDASATAVLRESAPLAVYAALLLLSPRVEFFVLTFVRPDREVGLFAAALLPVWFLAMVPGAITAGAMPALTREAVGRVGDEVRRRTSGTLALLGVAAGAGLALLARPVAGLLLQSGSSPADYAGTAGPLRIMAAAVPAMFLNALVAAALNASSRAGWLPRLIVVRVGVAFALATALVPRFGGAGAALGLACAEWILLVAGRAASRRAAFAVPVLGPLAAALAVGVPMALAVNGVREHLVAGVAVGALTWVATLAAAQRLAPALARRVMGDVRYP